MTTHRWLIWYLLVTLSWTLVRIVLVYSCHPLSGRRIARHQLHCIRLGRVLSALRRAHMLHPSVLATDYGTMVDYLYCHLSGDDWQYLVTWLPTQQQVS